MEEKIKKKHSELGIASFIIAIFEITIWIISFLDLFFLNIYIYSSITDELTIFLCFGIPVVSLMLGVGGLIQKERKKVFPILGIVLSFFELLGVEFIKSVFSGM
jgi:hypothetical protein